MNMHEQHIKFNAMWFSMPASNDLIPKAKLYEEVSQWQGKEIKETSQCLLGVPTQTLQGQTPTQNPIFIRINWCTRDVSEAKIHTPYKSYDDATLSYMVESVGSFLTVKDDFLLGHAGRMAEADPNTIRVELVKKRKLDENTYT
jgi:hypothetical protein